MKQLLQDLRTGELFLEEVPAPAPMPGGVVVRNHCSLVSAGTERAMVGFARQGLLSKARSRPDLVQQVVTKARQEGLLTTLRAVRQRLAQPQALGYSSAGVVVAVGPEITDLKVGDRVACAGAGYAVHAEVVSVPRHLVVKLPDSVDFEAASFTTLGAVAMHGLRLAQLQLGETVAVVGLGLVGLLTVQLAKAAGCTVVGMDPREDRCRLAEQVGCDGTAATAEAMKSQVEERSRGTGADAVILAADTSGSEPVELAAAIARPRATVVAVGAVGMAIPRRAYYEKELIFRVSRSYGPGRYDPDYEERGRDYPVEYVRWTENRNMEAFVQLLGEGKLQTRSLVTHRFPIEQARSAYDLVMGKGGETFLGVLMTYPGEPNLSPTTAARSRSSASFLTAKEQARALGGPARVGLLGAGAFATSTLLPAMKRVPGIELVGACSRTGLSARHAADRFGFRYSTTDEGQVLGDPDINTVVVATRHGLHARQAVVALEAGKHVFVEKPPALDETELRSLFRALFAQGSCILAVGYNRRFAPMARQLKAFLADIQEPLVILYRVNAGPLPPDHWVRDPREGGGRVIGEVCHFVDFLTFITGAIPVLADAKATPSATASSQDSVVVTLQLENGSLGTISYVASGDRALAKERVEVFGGGASAVLEDFRRLEMVRHGRRSVHASRWQQDKGHRGEWETLVASLKHGGPPPIPYRELAASSLATFAAVESLRLGKPVPVDTEGFLASLAPGREDRQGANLSAPS